MKIWLAGFGRTLDDISLDLQTLFLDMDRIPAGTEAARNKHVRPFDPPVNDRLDEITCPTLVMVGEYDAPELIESAGYLADRLSDQPAVVIPDAAHLPSLEQPGAFNRALSAFLATL